jgi:RNA polymerase sigma-70 factor (ECF subfamily)
MSESQQDFAALYEEYYPKLTRYLRRLVGEAEAEDVAQETFVKVSRSLDGFRGECQLSTWIYRIATNTSMDHLRKPSVRQSSRTGDGVAEGSEADEDFLVDSAPLHDTLLIRKDMNECIRGLVNDLPENYRTVLVLSDLEEFTNAEIGDVLGLSLDTVKIRLHRARQQLKKSMDHACYLYRDGRNEFSCDRKQETLEFKKM